MYLGTIVEEAPERRPVRAAAAPVHDRADVGGPDPGPRRRGPAGADPARRRPAVSPANPPTGCRFHTRCPFRQPTRCDDEGPALRVLGRGHRVACHWAEEIAAGEIRPDTTPVTTA